MKTRVSFFLCGALLTLSPLALVAEPTVAPANNGPTSQQMPAAAPKYNSGLDDIIKLSKAGVGDSVILSFVRNSRIAYNPTADDVIRLREAGISPQVITSVMERGEEMRQTATIAYNKNQAAAAAAVQPVAPVHATTTYSTPTTYSAPAQTTYVASPAPSTVTYIGAPTYFNYPVRSYCPPSYYSYSYNNCYYPRYAVGIRLGGGFYGGYGPYRCW